MQWERAIYNDEFDVQYICNLDLHALSKTSKTLRPIEFLND